MTKAPSSKWGPIYLLKSTKKYWKYYFVIFWEALQYEAMVQHMHTFHMDLHPSTYAQLKIPMVDV